MQQTGLRHPVARIKLQVKVLDQSVTHGQDAYSRYFGQKSFFCKGYSNFGLMAHPSKRACLSIDEISTASCAEPLEYSSGVSNYNVGTIVHQFLVLANPFDSLKDLRGLIQEKYRKLYPNETPPTFPYLRDENGCDLDDDYMVGEVYESNDIVIILSTSTISSNGVITPQSISITPIQKTVELAVPTPKGKPVPLFTDTASGISSNEPEAEKNQIVTPKVHEAAASEESTEYESTESESDESSSSYEEEESEEESSTEESVIVPAKSTANTSAATTVQSVDDKIAAVLKDEQDEYSSEYEVDASSTESETDSEAVETKKAMPSTSTTEEVQAPVESSSEYETDSNDSTSDDSSTAEETDSEDSSSEDETPAADSKKEDPKPVNVPSAKEYSSESEEEETETESEEESDSSENSGDDDTEKENVESSSSESDLGSESDDDDDDETEKVIPSTNVTSTLDLPITADDVQQVLKEVPKYTSLTTLKDCLSLAVSGRATPLQPQEKPIVPSASQPIKKGRVTLPRRKTRSNSNSGYDASLFR